MTDIYQAPTAELTQSTTLQGYGSLEKGVTGQFEFKIGEIFKESWEKTKGAKGTILLAILMYILVYIPASFGISAAFAMIGLPTTNTPGQPISTELILGVFLSEAILMSIILPLGAGLFMIGLKIASGVETTATEIFDYYNKILSLLACTIVMYIMIIIGLMLFVIPGIYLMFAYYLAIPLVVEKNLGPWAALETSRKAVTKCWFRFVGLGLSYLLLVLVAILPIGLGLIWVLPMMLIGFGIVYRNIFGFESTTTA